MVPVSSGQTNGIGRAWQPIGELSGATDLMMQWRELDEALLVRSIPVPDIQIGPACRMHDRAMRPGYFAEMEVTYVAS